MSDPTATTYDPQSENLPNHPGGTQNRVMWNEKFNLDSFIDQVAQTPPPAVLGSNHDAFKQGVYGTNSQGDYD